MRLPAALSTPDDSAALALLREYYAEDDDGRPHYTGAAFDRWDPSRTRAASVDVFTADDVLALPLLSVQLNGRAVLDLLVRRADELNALLAEVPADLDLVDVETPITRDWPASRLLAALRTLDRVGTTTATKLIARKRPRLRPVWDTVVATHLGVWSSYIEPFRKELQKDDRALHVRLVRLGQKAEVEGVSPLRVFDVVTWLEATKAGRRATGDELVEAEK
ncbi:DUF6308 family protein [Pseudokineococcus sp. 1T1Z-3]|uniref:DUF6308 family protein n=1 Tax=Pseudokineococcus sp. 1T1Z-3 TaxID=3132745 RepID=UPI0030A9713F